MISRTGGCCRGEESLKISKVGFKLLSQDKNKVCCYSKTRAWTVIVTTVNTHPVLGFSGKNDYLKCF